MNNINILLVEKDPYWKACIENCLRLEQDLNLIGTVETKADAVRTVQILEIDVVLMDVMLREHVPEGIEAALEIGRMKKAHVIMMAAVENDDLVVEAIGHLACNYLFKTHLRHIPEAIRAAHQNQSSIHYSSANAIRNEVVRMKVEGWRKQLTEAETGILRLVLQGQSYAQMSNILYISESTVKKHVNRILHKYQVRTSKEAAQKARLRGIL